MTDFSRLIERAATEFPAECGASAQIWRAGDQIGLRMQVIDIMHRFSKDVEFKPPGPNLRGFLFFGARQDFEITDAEFKYIIHGAGNLVTVEVEFRKQGGQTFAKFFARVDTNRDPLAQPTGKWEKGRAVPWKAALTYAKAVKDPKTNKLSLQLEPLGLKVLFELPAKGPLCGEGILFFNHRKELQTAMDGRRLLARVGGDKIFFTFAGSPFMTIALFLPFERLDVGMAADVPTTWEPIESTGGSHATQMLSFPKL